MIGAGKVQETLITGLEKLGIGYDSAGNLVCNNETVGFFMK